MGGFGDYLEKKKEQAQVINQPLQEEADLQQQILMPQEILYDAQRTKGLGSPTDADTVDTVFGYEEKTRQLQENNTTFQERTDYYFKDPKYLEAKKDRYISLASDKDGEVKAYSKRYKNRSARKRKNRAADAAKCFAKAADLEKSLAGIDEDDLQAEDLYKAREEIMMARLEGMINAAKVKATSEKD